MKEGEKGKTTASYSWPRGAVVNIILSGNEDSFNQTSSIQR